MWKSQREIFLGFELQRIRNKKDYSRWRARVEISGVGKARYQNKDAQVESSFRKNPEGNLEPALIRAVITVIKPQNQK